MSLFSIIVIVVIILLIRSSLAKQGKNSSGSGRKKSTLEEFLNSYSSDSVKNEKWMKIAGQLGGQFNRPAGDTGPSISGQRGNFRFHIFPSSSEKSRITYRVLFPSAIGQNLQIMHDIPATLEIMFRNVPKFTKKYFRAEDLACSATSEEWFAHYIEGEKRRPEILEMRELYHSMLVNDTGITIVQNDSLVPDPRIIENLLNSAAVLFPGSAPATTPVPSAPPARAVPPSATVPAPSRAVPPSAPASQSAKPSPVTGKTPSPEPNIGCPVSEVAGKPVPDSVSIDMEVLCRTLFTASFPGKAEESAFSSVKGKAVNWTGTLQSAYEYSYDFVFGSRKGVKATLCLCEIEGAFGAKQTVRAIVSFPLERAGLLRSKQNASIRFRGTLLKFDSFAKELYLTEGDVL